MKTLVLILTSSKYDLLTRCITSVENQEEKYFDFELKIILNTLNEEYAKLVINNITKYQVIRTESNGSPGKGHNSLFHDVFFKYKEFDYLLPIDGDDILYPCAFEQLKKFMEHKPDILHLMLNDHCTTSESFDNLSSIKLNNGYFLYSCLNNHQNFYTNNTKVLGNPYKDEIWKCRTPGRILLTSRNIFNMNPPLIYGEDMKLYDDMPASMSMIHSNNTNLNIKSYVISECNIYLYNKLNDHSASNIFNKELAIQEQINIKKYTELFNGIIDWDCDIQKLNFLNVSLPFSFDINKKITYCNKYVVQYDNQYNINKYVETGVNCLSITSNICDLKTLNILFDASVKYNNSVYLLMYGEKIAQLSNSVDMYKKLLDYSLKINNLINIEYYLNILKNIAPELYNKNCNVITSKKFTKTNQVLCYYTGETPPFNGKNYQERHVYGSEIAAIKLCEQLTKHFDVYIICTTDEEIVHNAVTYLNINSYMKLSMDLVIDYLIISRYTHAYLIFDTHKINNIYFLFHDTRCHEKFFGNDLPQLGLPLFFNNIENINKVICVSEWQKNNFFNIYDSFCKNIKLDKDKFVVIPNGISLEKFTNTTKNPFRFIYHSNPSRGLLKLCNIIIKLQKIYPETYLDIYFSDIEDKNILDLISLHGFLRFHGKLSNDLICQELCKTTFWIYPNVNSHETFCIAALEAISAGNIAMSLNSTGVGELVSKCGIVFSANDSDEKYVECVQNIMNNEELKQSYINKSIELSFYYDWKNISEKWINLLTNN